MPGWIEREELSWQRKHQSCVCVSGTQRQQKEESSEEPWTTAKLQMPQEDLWKECQVHIFIQNTRWADVPTDALLFFSQKQLDIRGWTRVVPQTQWQILSVSCAPHARLLAWGSSGIEPLPSLEKPGIPSLTPEEKAFFQPSMLNYYYFILLNLINPNYNTNRKDS